MHHSNVDYALQFGAMQMQYQAASNKMNKKKSGKKGGKKGKKGKKAPAKDANLQIGAFQKDTTLHGYPMEGPHTPSKKDVWYCDNKECQYTQHGIYRRYKIQNWRSTKFGKKFVLCDGCVRQYEKIKPQQQQQQQQQVGAPNVNVKLNINGGYQPGAPPPMQQPYAVAPPQQIYPNGYQQPMMPYQGQPLVQGQPLAQGQPIQYQQQQQQQPINGQYQQFGQQQSFYGQQGIPPPHFTGNNQQLPPIQQVMIQEPVQMEQKMENMDMNEDMNENVNPNVNQKGVVKQGWMMKKGDIVKSWKKRYFVLKSNKILNYYESDNAVMVKGTCSLNKVKTVKKKSGQSFEVQTPKRKWCFACKDTKTRDDWVNKIKNVAGV